MATVSVARHTPSSSSSPSPLLPTTTQMATHPSGIIMHTDLDPSSWKFSTVERNKMGGKYVNIMLSDTDKRSKIVFQTPPMTLPFGVTPYTDPSTGEIQSWNLDMSFKGMESDPALAKFYEKMQELDRILVEQGTLNSQAWFGKSMAQDVVSEFHRKVVRLPNNPQYAPTLRAKISLDGRSGTPAARFFDISDNKPPGIETTVDSLVKGSTIMAIMEVSSVWNVNKTFGTTLKCHQIAILSKPQRMDGWAFNIAHQGGGGATMPNNEIHMEEDNDEDCTEM
jgi:hypothetical protein